MGLFGFIPKGIRKGVRDIFDANTAEDQRKRLAAGQARLYQDQQAQARQQAAQQSKIVRPQVNTTGIKNNVNKFNSSFNERYIGGLGRGVIRGAEWLTPGDQTGTANKAINSFFPEAGSQAAQKGLARYADKNSAGGKLGTGAKAATEIVTMVVPSTATTRVVQGANAINKLSKGGRIAKTAATVIPEVIGGIPASATSVLQARGRGDKQDLGKEVGIGLALDAVTPLALKGVSKYGGKALNAIMDSKPKPTVKAKEIMDALPEEKANAYFNNYDQPKNGPNSQFSSRTKTQLLKDAEASAKRAANPKVQAKRTEMRLSSGDNPLKQTAIGGLERTRDMHASIMKLNNPSSPEYKNAAKAYKGIQEEIKRIDESFPISQKMYGKADTTTFADDVGEDILPKKPKVTLTSKDVEADIAKLDADNKSVRPEFDMDAANKYLDTLADDPVAFAKASAVIQRNIDETKGLQAAYDDSLKYRPRVTKNKPAVAAKGKTTNPTTGEVMTQPDTFVDQWSNGRLPDTNKPVVRAAAKAQIAAPIQESRLGSMADDFYQGAKGDKKISYNHLKDLGDKISAQIDSDFKAIGSNFEGVARKVQDAADAGVRKLDDVDLTPQERDLVRKAQAEMNYVRRRASLGRKQTDMGDLGEMYLPQQRVGDGSRDSLFDGFMAKKPGNEYTRKGLIDPAERDYSSNTVGGYVTRYADTKLTNRERILRAVTKDNPNVEPAAATQAADKIAKLQDEVNNLETSIGLGGLGRRRTRFDGRSVDFVERMNEVGQDLGHQQAVVTDVPRGLTNGDKINSVKVGDEILADNLGLNQWRDAGNYAASATTHADGDRQALAAIVEERLKTAYKMDPEDIAYTVDRVSNISTREPVDEKVVQGTIESIYKNAAKQQMLRQLQDVGIKDKGLRKVVSDLAADIVREGSIEQKVSSKAVSKILKVQNAIFRKFNVSSALNELGDLPSFLTTYGKNTSLIPDFNAVDEFGLGEIDAALTPYIRQVNEGVGLKKVLSSINDKTNLYKFVELYKAGVVGHSAKKHYAKLGLTGDALTEAVVRDYRNLALPVDAFTKTFLDNTPLYTQYMGWGARNLQKEGRLAAGTLEVGKLTDMSRMERVARNAYTNLPAKTVFWLASNGLKGTAILTAFGLTDFTGLSQQDFSGIQEEDKSLFDKTTQLTNTSTTLSMLNTIVQSLEKEQLKEKYKDADYNPYENNDVRHDLANKFTPQAYRNYDNANKLYDKGYSENKSGNVQYEASDDFGQKAKAFVLGKSTTRNAREASGRQDIVTRLKAGQNPLTAIKDMALEDVGAKETNYKRPINKDYSKAYKEADKGARTALLQGGRQYNAYLDDLKKTSKPAYDNYISTMDGNHVNPEFWKKVGGKDGMDLTVFKSLQARKKQLNKDLGKAYDPIYDLPDDQARSVMQQKATATGDDIVLRNKLYKAPWYQDYVKKTSAYYDKLGEKGEGGDQTKRVKDWYAYETKLNDLSNPSGGWAKDYPIVNRQKQITEKYGFDSAESKAFFKQYGDAYRAEKSRYDQGKLAIINKMRKIEGHPEMSADEYTQATKIADTDKDTGDKYASSGGSSKVNTTKGMSPTEFVKSKKVAFKKPSELKKVKLTAAKLTKAKVTSKKSLV